MTPRTPRKPRPFARRVRDGVPFRVRANRWLQRPRSKLYTMISIYINGVRVDEVAALSFTTKSRPCR